MGGKTSVLLPIGLGMAAVALVLLIGGAGLLLAGSRRSDDRQVPVTPPRVPASIS